MRVDLVTQPDFLMSPRVSEEDVTGVSRTTTGTEDGGGDTADHGEEEEQERDGRGVGGGGSGGGRSGGTRDDQVRFQEPQGEMHGAPAQPQPPGAPTLEQAQVTMAQGPQGWSQLFQVTVPAECEGQFYGELLQMMIAPPLHLIAIGIYRKRCVGMRPVVGCDLRRGVGGVHPPCDDVPISVCDVVMWRTPCRRGTKGSTEPYTVSAPPADTMVRCCVCECEVAVNCQGLASLIAVAACHGLRVFVCARAQLHEGDKIFVVGRPPARIPESDDYDDMEEEEEEEGADMGV